MPNEVRDALTEVLREGARTLLAQAIEAEVAEFLAGYADQRWQKLRGAEMIA